MSCFDCIHCKVCGVWKNAKSLTQQMEEAETLECFENKADFEKNDWISVNDRLPDNNSGVLCYVKSTTISGARVYALGNCHNKQFWFLQNSVGTSAYPMQQWVVTHWRPLPEPPKEV